MHKQRRHILLRWIVSVGIVLGTAGWLGFSAGEQLMQQQDRSRVSAPPAKIPLPSQQETQTLQATIRALRTLRASSDDARARLRPSPNLITEAKAPVVSPTSKPGEQGGQNSNAVSVSLILVSPGRSFAVLNGKVYEEGGILPDGRQVTTIQMDRVVLELEGQEDILPWIPPQSVGLVKVEPKPLVTKTEQATTAATPAEDAAKAQPLSPEEALQKAKETLKQ
ncbi:MAG: hypothetical protein AB7E47_15465 [Desulfovibrionaceae bacterium]